VADAPAPNARTSPPSKAARRGKLVGQAIFAAAFVWIVFSGSAQIVAENFFVKHPPIDAPTCRARLAVLRRELADAAMLPTPEGEVAALAQFRAALGGAQGRLWDAEALALLDGCPKPEADAAYALARLRASDEAMLRHDVRLLAPARRANASAQHAIEAP
jgi:hypothetical protein